MRLVWCVPFVLVGCANLEEASRPIVFDDEAVRRGLDYTYVSGSSSDWKIPEIMGGGVAVVDSDQDGDLDLYFIQGGLIGDTSTPHENALYINNGDGEFSIVDGAAASRNLGYGMGVAIGDVNRDKLPDIFVSQLGLNRLLINQGENQFKDLAEVAGLSQDEWSTAAAFADFDRDGDLDLWVVNYIDWRESIEIECYQSMLGSRDYCSPVMYNRPAQDRFYLNDGKGRFKDATKSAGIKGIRGNGLGSVVADFNGDGLLDVFVANDTTPNHLWINQGNAVFEEQADKWGCAYDLHGEARAGMGVSSTDLDDDGDQDLIVVNITTESDYVFRNEGSYFTDIAPRVGLSIFSQRYTRFGIDISDFNNDGWPDIFVANGAVARLSNPTNGDIFAEPNSIYVGNGTGRFDKPIYTSAVQTSRGAVAGDFNSDGRVDLVVVNRDSKANLLINKSRSGQWLTLDIRDKDGNPAIGSRVSLSVGERTVTRTVITSGSYLSSGDPKVYIGLGQIDVVTNLEIDWLNGSKSVLGKLTSNQTVRIDQPPE